ncbi:hypothetical protein DCC62_30165 [candidate division KSB1 bacterium]|nr:MAG: hypothetical protein DCC62_30165 [candidate division KSB1 bacterium]
MWGMARCWCSQAGGCCARVMPCQRSSACWFCSKPSRRFCYGCCIAARKTSGSSLPDRRLTALPFFVMGLLGILHSRVDVMLLAALRDNAEVGVFSAASSFVKVLRIAPSVIVASFFPAIAGMQKNSPQLRKLAAKTLWAQFAFSLSLAVIIFLLADWLIARTYDFPAASTVLRVQVWSIIPLALYSTLVYVFFQADKSAWNVGILAATLLLNVILNYLLIPGHGALAPALSNLASESFCCVLYFSLYRRLPRAASRVF